MDSLPSTDGMPSGQVLIDMIKKQLVLDARDQDARRDAFLSLAVSIPPRPRARIRDALGPLLARARRIGSRRDSVWSSLPDDTRTNTITKSPHREGSSVIEDDHVSTGADDASSLARELERNVGVLATLLVLGYPDACDLDLGRRLMFINHWSVKSSIWAERTLLKHKDLSLQLAFSTVLGLLHRNPWTSSSPPPSPFAEDYRALARRVRADYRGAELSASAQSFWLSWEGLHARSLQLAGLIACVLRSGGFEDVPRSDLLPLLRGPRASVATTTADSGPDVDIGDRDRSEAGKQTHSTAQTAQIRVPLLENAGSIISNGTTTTTTNITTTDGPVSSESGAGPVRAQPGSWQAWYASRVRDLVSSIAEDEWYGYYVYTLDWADGPGGVGSSDPAMENIHFRLGDSEISHDNNNNKSPTSNPRPNSSPNPTTTKSWPPSKTPTSPTPKPIPLSALGARDGVTAHFDLTGTVNPATGVVSLRKRYHGAHHWDYDGVVTPVGIVGEWGREGTAFDGYFWLWKKGWMDGGAVPRTYGYS